jgi:hypothetical protein
VTDPTPEQLKAMIDFYEANPLPATSFVVDGEAQDKAESVTAHAALNLEEDDERMISIKLTGEGVIVDLWYAPVEGEQEHLGTFCNTYDEFAQFLRLA